MINFTDEKMAITVTITATYAGRDLQVLVDKLTPAIPEGVTLQDVMLGDDPELKKVQDALKSWKEEGQLTLSMPYLSDLKAYEMPKPLQLLLQKVVEVHSSRVDGARQQLARIKNDEKKLAEEKEKAGKLGLVFNDGPGVVLTKEEAVEVGLIAEEAEADG